MSLFLAVVAVVVLIENFQDPKISNTLSDRSLEFLETQKADNSSKFTGLGDIEEKEDFRGERVQVGECFSFVMPYSVFNRRSDGECQEYFAFENPRGTMVAFTRGSITGSLDEAPGVAMRRQNPDQYEEREIKIGDTLYLGFVDLLNQFTITVYRSINDQYLILTLKLPQENEEELENILSSLEFN